MNKLIRSGSIVILGMAVGLPYQAHADSVSPSVAQMTVNDLYVSKNTDCSHPVQVMHNPGAGSVNLVTGPSLGSGAVAKGTYPCIIVGVNSMMSITPAASTTASTPPECQAGVPISQQICRSGQSYVNPGNGQTVNCQTSVATEVYAYFSTTGSASNSNTTGGFSPAGPLPLNSAVVVTGNHTLTFVVDFDNSMSDDGRGSLGGTCQTQAPVMQAR